MLEFTLIAILLIAIAIVLLKILDRIRYGKDKELPEIVKSKATLLFEGFYAGGIYSLKEMEVIVYPSSPQSILQSLKKHGIDIQYYRSGNYKRDNVYTMCFYPDMGMDERGRLISDDDNKGQYKIIKQY